MRVSIVSVTEGAPSYSSKHKKILTCSYMTHNLLVTGRKIFSQPQDLRTRSLRFFANRPVRKLSLYLLRKEALSYDLALRGVIESFPSFYITNAGGTFRTCSGRVTSPLYLSALSWCVRRHLLILAQSVADSLPLSEGSSAEADGEVTRSGMQKAKINSGRTFRITRTVSRPFP